MPHAMAQRTQEVRKVLCCSTPLSQNPFESVTASATCGSSMIRRSGSCLSNCQAESGPEAPSLAAGMATFVTRAMKQGVC